VDKTRLDLELIQFTTGLELFQAMIGGSLDVLSTGAVVSNFPARGQGKVFLLNNIEYATAQLWVRDDSIKSIADLKGKQISTTTGTTAHVFLDRALRSAKLDPAKDVQLVNQRMAEAVTSFVSGAVPAVALWVPFDVTVKQKVPNARKIVDASAFFPEAAIMGGGRRATSSTTPTSRPWPRSSPAGPKRTMRCWPTSTPRPRRCRKPSTRKCRSPTSRTR
jgi:NitT/TauT family transport system substrate-binding protein